MDHSTFDVLILAGGASTRLGRPKQLLPFQGKSLLHNVLEKTRRVSHRVHVVLGAHSQLIMEDLRGYPLLIHHNARWEQGISSSIRNGVSHVPTTSSGVLIVLTDQPLIPLSHFQQIQEAWREKTHGIIASSYGQRYGVPALFSAKYFPLLQSLQGDKGMRDFFQRFEDDIKAIPCEMALHDIDTPDDVTRILDSADS